MLPVSLGSYEKRISDINEFRPFLQVRTLTTRNDDDDRFIISCCWHVLILSEALRRNISEFPMSVAIETPFTL